MLTVLGVLGTVYSGSTALGMALNSHPEIGFIGESGHAISGWFEPYVERYKRPPLCDLCRPQGKECPFWDTSEMPYRPEDVHRVQAERRGVNIIADTTKFQGIFEKLVAASSADRYAFVILIKEPLRQLASFRRNLAASWLESYDATGRAKAYCNQYRGHLEFVADKPHRIFAYEEFASDPALALNSIAEMLAVDPSGFDPINYRRFPHHTIGGNLRALTAKSPIHLDETWHEYHDAECPIEARKAMEEVRREVLAARKP